MDTGKLVKHNEYMWAYCILPRNVLWHIDVCLGLVTL